MSILARLRGLMSWGAGIAVGLPEATEARDPLELFGEWFAAAGRTGIRHPEAMTVATATPDGRPSARMALLKAFDERGFVFYTNYGSRKGREIDANPQVALVLHWNVLDRQVRIEGSATRLPAEESFAYFRTRPRGSRLAAWASAQSEELASREELLRRFREMEARFDGSEIPLPPFWGGFRVVPERIEFWQGRVNRLHDRLRFERGAPGSDWVVARLFP